MVQSQDPKETNSKSIKSKQEKNIGWTPQWSRQLVMQESVPFTERGNPSSVGFNAHIPCLRSRFVMVEKFPQPLYLN